MPEAIREFLRRVGVAKTPTTIEIELLEHCLREDLNLRAPRVMAVLDPLKVVIDNYPEGQVEELEAINNPEDESAGTRMLPFSREVYIERDDFSEDPPPKYFRLAPGREVRLKHAYFVTCRSFERDEATGEVKVLHCTYDPESRGGESPDGRKVKGTLHWVSAAHAVPAEVKLFDHLLREAVDDDSEDVGFEGLINPDSLETIEGCMVEPALAAAEPGSIFQFLRHGYFCMDTVESRPGAPVFNRSVSLRDTWAKIQKAGS